MAKPKVTVEGRTRPVGDKKTGRTNLPGLVFTRVRGVRRIKAFAATPRNISDLTTPEEFFEERYRKWEARYGGTRPEYIVWHYLKVRRRMREGVDFIFQSSRQGGRQQLGGSVVDFELPMLRLMFRVQGERFHLASPEIIASDILQGISLRGLRFTIVDLYAEDVEQRTTQTIESGLRGITLRGPIRGIS